jgi:hypothetical protein
MRIVIAGDRAWACDDLAMVIVQRPIARYGRDIVVVHAGSVGVDESFNIACKNLGIAVEVRMANSGQTGTPTLGTRNRELIKPGADLCIALHRSLGASQRTKDCVHQAIQADIPTFLVEDERAMPIRLRRADPRLSGRG